MRPNLINRLKEEWNNLDPVDPLRGLIADAIDALAEQPAQQCWKCGDMDAEFQAKCTVPACGMKEQP